MMKPTRMMTFTRCLRRKASQLRWRVLQRTDRLDRVLKALEYRVCELGHLAEMRAIRRFHAKRAPEIARANAVRAERHVRIMARGGYFAPRGADRD